MVVVRALTTLLNFKLDTSNLKKFNKEIFGIKTRVNSIFGEISDKVRTGFDFLADISKAALQTQDLAKYSGIALKDFVALKNVAGQFGVSADEFNKTFTRFSLGVKEASRRTGFLLDIIRQLPHQINIKGVNDTLRPTQEILFDVLKSISSIKDESEQLRLSGNVFGDIHQGQRWLEIFKQSPIEFKKLLDEQLKFGEQFEKDSKSFGVFNTEVNKFTIGLTNFWNLISGVLAPVSAEILKNVNASLDSVNNFILKNGESSKKQLENLTKNPLKFAAEGLGNFFGGEQASKDVFFDTKIDINVAPGTPEQQVRDIANEMSNALKNFHDEKVRELINNNPVYEA